MKQCYSCGAAKPLVDFNINNSKPDGRQDECRLCSREYGRKHYLNNKSKYTNKNKRRVNAARTELIKLKNKPCLDCGGNFPPCVMDFDHRPGTEKVGNVSALGSAQFISFKKLYAEIDKCDLVCANCHRIRTHNRMMGATDIVG